MTVESRRRAERTGQWRSVLQRGLDTGYRLSGRLVQWISVALEPRARLLRRRRRALRWGLIFAGGSLFWGLATVLLAAWGWFTLLLQITGLIAAVQAFAATLLLVRYRWLRSIPLPAQRPGGTRRLPPPGSAARPAMTALAASERGLFALLGVLERGALLPAGEIADLTAVANRTAATMAATAAEVVSMEHAAESAPNSRSYLVPTINAFSTQLAAGVRQYDEMVSAAAQLVESTNNGQAVPAGSVNSPMSRQRYRAELVEATDRLVSWAQAFDELGRPA